MTSRKQRFAALLMVAAAPLALAACSSESAPMATSSASAMPSNDALLPMDASEGPMVGGDPATWAPVQVTAMDNGKSFDLVVGQYGNISGLPMDDASNNIVVTSDNNEVVMPVQGDGVTSVPGFHAMGPGMATVVVYDGYMDKGDVQPILQFMVNVNAPVMQ